MIICFGGFIFSACFCLADMFVPFNPLIRIKTEINTERERDRANECIDKAREHLRIIALPLPLAYMSQILRMILSLRSQTY